MTSLKLLAASLALTAAPALAADCCKEGAACCEKHGKDDAADCCREHAKDHDKHAEHGGHKDAPEK